MATSMHANPEALRSLGNEVLNHSTNYKDEIAKIYATIDNLSANWEGPDNQEFINQVNEYKETLEALGKMIGNNGQFLVDTGNNIEKITNEIKNSANNMYNE